MNTESSPLIPAESRVLRIPSFFQFLPHSQEIPSEISSLIEIQTSYKSSKSCPAPSVCKCPHLLISDDDPFQEFFYLALFKKMVDTGDLPQDFRLRVFRSGEELLKHYSSVLRKCGCGSCSMVITDYDMGRQKLNGVETALTLRKAGYKGPVILRTSEKEDYLHERHPNFNKLLENNVIHSLHEKSNVSKIRDAVQNLMKRQDALSLL